VSAGSVVPGKGRGPYAPAIGAVLNRIAEQREAGLPRRTWYRHLLFAAWLANYAPEVPTGVMVPDVPQDLLDQLEGLESEDDH
jgi:hypothetical protein